MATSVITRSRTSEHESSAALARAQSRLPMTSRSLAVVEERPNPKAEAPRTTPALSQPIFAKPARKQDRWGVAPHARIEMVNAARKGPLTSDLLRCFLFRFYSPKPALWVGEYVQMRSGKPDGSWEKSLDAEKPITVRIDKVQCGKKDGLAFGKTLAYWRYQVSYPTPGQPSPKIRTTVDKWDLELGTEAELGASDGPGVLPTSSMITNDVRSLKNPFAQAYGPKSLTPPSARVEQQVARRAPSHPSSEPRRGSFFQTNHRANSGPRPSQSIYQNVRVHPEKLRPTQQPVLRMPPLMSRSLPPVVQQLSSGFASLAPSEARSRARSLSDLTGHRAPQRPVILMPRRHSPDSTLVLPPPSAMMAESTLGQKRSRSEDHESTNGSPMRKRPYDELQSDQRDMVELPEAKSRRMDVRNLMSEGERSSPVKFSF